MIKVNAEPWSDEAAQVLAAAVEHVSVAELQKQAAAGAVLFRVTQDENTVGFYLLRVDQTADGAEGVLVAAGGRAEFDITAVVMPHVEKQFTGCQWLRVHTSRPGMVKKLARYGYEGLEMVMRKRLCN